MNIFKGIVQHTVNLYHAIDRGFRGPVGSKDKPDFEHDRRQLCRAKLTRICGMEMARLDVPRRIRRLMARQKAKRLYRKYRASH